MMEAEAVARADLGDVQYWIPGQGMHPNAMLTSWTTGSGSQLATVTGVCQLPFCKSFVNKFLQMNTLPIMSTILSQKIFPLLLTMKLPNKRSIWRLIFMLQLGRTEEKNLYFENLSCKAHFCSRPLYKNKSLVVPLVLSDIILLCNLGFLC